MMAVTTTNIPNEHIALINNSTTMMAANPQGPATQALERCLKRRRTDSPTDAFSFTEVFNNLTPSEESFPVIAWDFDDADEGDKGAGPKPVEKSLHKRTEEPLSKKPRGMIRCKSYRSGLSLLCKQQSL